MADDDQPPVGLLLCTSKNHSLVEYALAGMDNQLFVSRYQFELPKKEDLERLLEAEVSRAGPHREAANNTGQQIAVLTTSGSSTNPRAPASATSSSPPVLWRGYGRS